MPQKKYRMKLRRWKEGKSNLKELWEILPTKTKTHKINSINLQDYSKEKDARVWVLKPQLPNFKRNIKD